MRVLIILIYIFLAQNGNLLSASVCCFGGLFQMSTVSFEKQVHRSPVSFVMLFNVRRLSRLFYYKLEKCWCNYVFNIETFERDGIDI